jgi:hypothetical protein
MSKHHAIYMRVSTKRQDTASQEPELKSWAQSHEGDSCWYHDSYTGTSMDRPGFRQLIKDMETGQVDTLVVWRLDRLGRTAKGLTSLFDDLTRYLRPGSTEETAGPPRFLGNPDVSVPCSPTPGIRLANAILPMCLLCHRRSGHAGHPAGLERE